MTATEQLCRLAAELADEVDLEHCGDDDVIVEITVTIGRQPERRNHPTFKTTHTRKATWSGGEWNGTLVTRREEWA